MVAVVATLQEQATAPIQISFKSAAYSPTAANDLRKGTPTAVAITMTGVASAAARQSAKFDFGASRAQRYSVRAAIELAATPTAGATVDIYLAPSSSATAATGNAGAVSGSDAAYSGYSSNISASVKQLIPIGVFVCTAQATATVQVAECGEFTPPERYGSLVVVNSSSAAIHSDDQEFLIVLDPIVPEAN